MTAMVTLDICRQIGADLKTEVKIPKEAVGVEGSSLYLKQGEKKTLEDLLYGLMSALRKRRSGAFAEIMGGNQRRFCTADE